MNTIPVSEIKRRGLSVADKLLKDGPVHVIKNNTPHYVVLSEKDYDLMLQDLADARLRASEVDLAEGNIRSGSVKDLLKEITEK